MNRIVLSAFFFQLACFSALAQETPVAADSLAVKEKKWSANIDLLSRYIWRGQSYGGNYPTLQVGVNYNVTPKLTVGLWGSTNFRKEYYYPDGETYYRGYNEFDVTLSYQLTDYLSLQLADYYWPALEEVEGVDNNYFNYGPDGTKSVDFNLIFDFSEGYRYPFNGTLSTLIAGNDYRFDEEGENATRNFTTYLEVGYTFSTIAEIEISPTIGAVLNNRAGYYSAADYDKASFINLSAVALRTLDLGKGFTMPLTVTYTHNAATANTESFGKNFVVAGIGLYYE